MAGLIDTLFSPRMAADADPTDDFWYQSLGAGSVPAAGIRVTPERAVQLPVVQSSLAELANPIGYLPLVFFRRNDDGSKERVTPMIDSVLRHQANAEHTAAEFRATMQWNLGLYRNAYAEILPSRRSVIGGLRAIHPSLVMPEQTAGGVRYRVSENGRTRTLLPGTEIWHLRATPLAASGLSGDSVVESSREVISKALALQDYASRFFANDGTPTGGILQHPSQFKDKESRDNFLSAWQRARGGANRHKVATLEYGIEYKAPEVQSNKESQFLESKKENDLDLARIWNMPPHKVGILDRATFSNIEQQSLEFVTDTLMIWLVLWEQAIKRDLIFEEDIYCEFNVAGLLRGDLKARYEAYAIARNWGWLSVNDIRKLENSNPIDDGDIYLQPLNMQEAGDRAVGGNPQPKSTTAAEPSALDPHTPTTGGSHA